METTTTTFDDDKQKLISSFIQIDGGQTDETAVEFLEATNWNLEEAMQLFRMHTYIQDKLENDYPKHIPLIPLTLIRDALSPVVDAEQSRLSSSLYHPPRKLLFQGSFEEAKTTSSRKDLWLLVNLQSTTVLASRTLDRDLWSNNVVSRTIESNFILLQVYDDTMEGKRISTVYEVGTSPPVVLLINPITGQKMRSWSREIEAQSFEEDLVEYIDCGPREHIAFLTRNKRMKTENKSCDDHIVASSKGEEET